MIYSTLDTWAEVAKLLRHVMISLYYDCISLLFNFYAASGSSIKTQVLDLKTFPIFSPLKISIKIFISIDKLSYRFISACSHTLQACHVKFIWEAKFTCILCACYQNWIVSSKMTFTWPEMGGNNYKQIVSWFCLLNIRDLYDAAMRRRRSLAKCLFNCKKCFTARWSHSLKVVRTSNNGLKSDYFAKIAHKIANSKYFFDI